MLRDAIPASVRPVTWASRPCAKRWHSKGSQMRFVLHSTPQARARRPCHGNSASVLRHSLVQVHHRSRDGGPCGSLDGVAFLRSGELLGVELLLLETSALLRDELPEN